MSEYICIEVGRVSTQAQADALIRIIELAKPLLANGGGHAEAGPPEAPQGQDKTPPGYLRDPVAGERARRGATGGGEPDHAAGPAGAAGGDGAGAVKKYGPPDINEISDLCMTSFVTDKMTADEVNEFYQGVLCKIYDALYPELPGIDAAPEAVAKFNIRSNGVETWDVGPNGERFNVRSVDAARDKPAT